MQGQIKYSKSTEPPTAVLDMNWYTELLTLLAKPKSDVAENYTSCLKRGTPVCRDNKLIKTVEDRIPKEKVCLKSQVKSISGGKDEMMLENINHTIFTCFGPM